MKQNYYLQDHFCLFYYSKLNATQNENEKYKKFMTSELPNQHKAAPISDYVYTQSLAHAFF